MKTPDDMHPCPVPECDRRCSSAYLMCRTDWWRVSPLTRQRVYDTFAGGAGLFDPSYRDARDQAIAEAVASRTRAKERNG